MASSTKSTASPLPPRMRAWHRPARGPVATHLLLTDDRPTPQMPATGSSDVLVRVTHVALEYALAELMPVVPAMPLQLPLIPELEYSGTVVAAGNKAPAEVREAGTRVLGFQTPLAMYVMGKGVLTEYVCVPGQTLTRIPDGLIGERAMEQAAGLVGPGSTALKIMRTAQIKPGDRVLVNGASGAVGNMALQLAHERQAYVVGVASGRNESLVCSAGADEFVDYTQHTSLADYLAAKYADQPFKHIIDCVGSQQLYVGSPAYLKPEGAVINIGAMIDSFATTVWNWFQNTWRPVWLGGIPRRYIMFSTIPLPDDAIILLRMVEEGKLVVHTDGVWPMTDALQAYERMASKRARGKIIVKVADI